MFNGERHTVPTISVADPGCLSRVVKIPGSGSASNNLNYFNLKKLFLCSRKYEPVCSSRIPDVVKKAPIPDLDPQHCLPYYGLKSPYSLVPSGFFWHSFLHFSALEALRKKEISANKAAKVYKIPSSTLYKIARYIYLYLFLGNRYCLCA